MPDEISGMGKTHGNASLLCKNCQSFTYSVSLLYIFIKQLTNNNNETELNLNYSPIKWNRTKSKQIAIYHLTLISELKGLCNY
jgi:hypothetical protein